MDASLADLLEARREDILRRWVERRTAQPGAAGLSGADVVDNLPSFLDQLIACFRAPDPACAGECADELAQAHGRRLQQLGVDINALVWDYALLRDVLLDVIEEARWPLAVAEVRVLSRTIAAAIGGAVAHYTREREQQAAALLGTLRASQVQLQGLLDSAVEGIFGVDTQGACVFANRACAQLLGYTSPGELLGADMHERVHHTREDGTHLPREECRMYQAFRDGQATDVEDEVFWRKDGSSFPVRYRSAPIVEAGRRVGAVAVFEDITERRRAAEAARQHALFAEQLVGIVSHDLRTPLNAILLSTVTLGRHEGLDAHALQVLARIRSAVERASRMIHDLLDFTQARLGQGIPIVRQPLDLHALVDPLVEEVRLAHPGRSVLVAHQGEGHGEWDADRLAQVVMNLLGNALAYSPADTPVQVETQGEDAEVVLRVHNLGAPIPPQLLPQLFLPLKRGSTQPGPGGRSVGLGLFIVEHLVRRHGGQVEVHSSAEAGTTFSVRLPRRAP